MGVGVGNVYVGLEVEEFKAAHVRTNQLNPGSYGFITKDCGPAPPTAQILGHNTLQRPPCWFQCGNQWELSLYMCGGHGFSSGSCLWTALFMFPWRRRAETGGIFAESVVHCSRFPIAVVSMSKPPQKQTKSERTMGGVCTFTKFKSSNLYT